MKKILALLLLLTVNHVVKAEDPPVVKFGKLSAVAPAGWKVDKPANRLRSHQFKIPNPEKDFADGEVIVLPESHPDPEKSFPSWKKTFTPPDGKTAEDVTKTEKWMVGTATIHVLDITGTWSYKERPQDPKSKLEVRPEYRAIWAIVVAGEDAVHVRLSGPQVLVEKNKETFEKWLKGMK